MWQSPPGRRRAGADVLRLGFLRAGFSLALAYLLLAQSVLCLGLSTQHALAAASDPGTLFCHADAATPDGAGPAGLALAGPAAPSVPATPAHDAGPAMAPCAICAFASTGFVPPAALGAVPLARSFVRLQRPPLQAPQVVAQEWTSPRLSQGPPNPA